MEVSGQLHAPNVRMDLGEIAWEGVDRMNLAQDKDQCRAFMNMVMNLRVL
jgi:hypothetical protein